MPANVETAAYANTPAWHREGVVLDTDGEVGMDVRTALTESGLDWTVEKCPIYARGLQGEEVLIQDRFGVQRNDGDVLGVVGSTWEPVQNSEGFALIEDFMQGDRAFIEAAGALNGGKKVWILAHMAEDLQIAGEDINQYVLFTNGHDGRSSVTAAMTNVRVVCQNTLALALDTTERVVRVRHTRKATERLAAAKQILGIRDKYAEDLAKQGEWLVNNSMTDRQFDNFLAKLMPIADDQELKPAGTMIRDRRTDVRALYATADNLNNIRGTRWGALNAVVEYADHGRKFQDTETQLKAQWSITPAPIKDRAFQLLRD